MRGGQRKPPGTGACSGAACSCSCRGGVTAVRMRCRLWGTSRGGPGGSSPARLGGPGVGGFPGAAATCTDGRALPKAARHTAEHCPWGTGKALLLMKDHVMERRTYVLWQDMPESQGVR